MNGRRDDFVDKSTGLPEEEDFEALFEAQQSREAAAGAQLEPGEVVRGTIIQIGRDAAFVDLGGKTEGYIGLEDLLDENGAPRVAVGQEIEAYVASVGGDGVKLSLALGKGSDALEELETAFQNRIPVEGRVAATNKGGVEVEVAGQRAFCPVGQLDLGFVADPTVFIGQSLRFVIQRLEGGRRPNIVLSRRSLLEEERAELARETRKKVVEGAILEGRVRNVRDFGAFVDLGGVDGLVHVSELAWERIEDPTRAVKEGDTVTVKVLKADWEHDRISLSIKAALPDPWDSGVKTIQPGAVLRGTIVRLADYGAFVELQPGLDGLIHVSELAWRRVRQPSDVVQVGDAVTVKVLEVDTERRRVGLSLKQVEGDDPWTTAAERYPVGATVEGTVEKTERFGIFVEIEPGLTALIPASETNTDRGSDVRRQFAHGQKVSAQVLTVQPDERRMSLSLSALVADSARADVETYQKAQREQAPRAADGRGGGGATFGTLGDLLRSQLDKGNKK